MKLPTLRIFHKGMLLVAVPLIFELLFVAVMVALLSQAEAEVNREVAARRVIERSNDLLLNAQYEIESVRKTHDSTSDSEKGLWQVRAEQARKAIFSAFEDLNQLLASDRRKLELLAETRRIAEQAFTTTSRYWDEVQTIPDGFERQIFRREIMGRSEAYSARLIEKVDSIVKGARLVEKESPAAQIRNRANIQRLLFAAVVFNIALALALAVYFTKDITGRLTVINDNTMRFGQGDELNPLQKGDDEIGNVDRVFHEMAERLKEADRLKREFMSMISHDLKTPLCSLQALLTLLEAGTLGDLPDRTRTRIRGAEEDVERLINLVQELLDVERLSEGKLDLSMEAVELDDLLQRSAMSVIGAAERKEISINVSTCQLSVLGDKFRLIQVIVNLLSNAVKFSPKGTAIDVIGEEQGQNVRISVKDRGRGIPPEHLSAIFDRFRQVERSDAIQKGGTGLGLSISKAIIEQHGGQIGVNSQVGVGSTFWIILPKLPSPSDNILAASPSLLESNN